MNKCSVPVLLVLGFLTDATVCCIYVILIFIFFNVLSIVIRTREQCGGRVPVV